MLLTRFRGWFLAGLLFIGASPVHAQHDQRVNPPGVSGDHQPMFFDHADLSEYGTANKAKSGYFFQYDRTLWAFTGPKKTPIGNPDAAGTITNTIVTNPPGPGGPTTTIVTFINNNTVDTGFIQTDYVQGNRYEFGYIDDDSGDGWMGSVLHVHNQHQAISVQNATIAFGDPFLINSQFVDFNRDGIQDDVNGNGIFGNNSPFNVDTTIPPDGTLDAYVGPDFGDLLSLPVSFGTLFSINFTKLSSYELMRVVRWDPLHTGGTMEWLYGLRYTQISDDFIINGINGTGIVTTMNINSSLRNHMIGPQVGLRWNKQTGAWRVGAEGRVMAAENFQQIQVYSNFTGLITNSQLQSGTVVGGNDSQTDATWAPLGELRLDLSYQVTNAISLRMGYTGLFAGGITRASRRVDYQLPQALVLDSNKSEAFIINGFNFGIEINR